MLSPSVTRTRSPRTTLLGRDRLHLAVAAHAGLRFDEDGQLVEVPFGLEFLHQADSGVNDCHAADGNGTLVLVEVEQGDGCWRYQRIEET